VQKHYIPLNAKRLARARGITGVLTMTTNVQTGSATIYEFPRRGRFAVSGQADASTSIANPALQRAPKISFGSGWYHDEAIQEERARGN
jgi:Protein of unknown function (DUF2735)